MNYVTLAVDATRAFLMLLSSLRSHANLAVENLALRQQLAVLKQRRPKPRLSGLDRMFWVLLSKYWKHSGDALIIVKPETVVRWHRAGFRRYWRRLSRRRSAGRPSAGRQLRELISTMARESPGWGAPRIHGELAKLGFAVSERTVSRYLRRRPPDADKVARWNAFLRNHREVLAGMDFFTVPTVGFRVLYVFFIVHHARRRILHVSVTSNPWASWVIQQLRDAIPSDTDLRYLIFDRDTIFSRAVVRTVKFFAMKPVRTSHGSPWQNGVAERWIASCRGELLDHVVVLDENHLRRLLKNYLAYYHQDRTHLGLGKDTPNVRPVEKRPSSKAEVISLPRVGGIHHRYMWSDAA